MTNLCLTCRRPRLELAKTPVLEIANTIFDVLLDQGGRVETQNALMAPLLDCFRIGRGTAQRYIDALRCWVS